MKDFMHVIYGGPITNLHPWHAQTSPRLLVPLITRSRAEGGQTKDLSSITLQRSPRRGRRRSTCEDVLYNQHFSVLASVGKGCYPLCEWVRYDVRSGLLEGVRKKPRNQLISGNYHVGGLQEQLISDFINGWPQWVIRYSISNARAIIAAITKRVNAMPTTSNFFLRLRVRH